MGPQQERAAEAQVVEQHAKEIAEQHGAEELSQAAGHVVTAEEEKLVNEGPEKGENVMAELVAMGYDDTALLQEVVSKSEQENNGTACLSDCVHDLTLLNEWDYLLDDLSEMGFENREVNRSLLLHNKGNLRHLCRSGTLQSPTCAFAWNLLDLSLQTMWHLGCIDAETPPRQEIGPAPGAKPQ